MRILLKELAGVIFICCQGSRVSLKMSRLKSPDRWQELSCHDAIVNDAKS